MSCLKMMCVTHRLRESLIDQPDAHAANLTVAANIYFFFLSQCWEHLYVQKQ